MSSSRVAGTGTPIPLRAERRVAAFDSQGTSKNPFAILQNLNNNDLNQIVVDCGIILGDNEEEVNASIDLIKAKELAQATLAEVEKAKAKGKTVEIILEVEELEDPISEFRN